MSEEIAVNRKARHDYEILDTYEAGMVLVGTEIKSIRQKKVNISDAYVLVNGTTVTLKNASIQPYQFGNIYNHDEKRERKLLLHRDEIAKLAKASDEKGLTIVPLALYLKKGYAKLLIGTAKGKKAHDKRSAMKEGEAKREIARALKEGDR